MMVNKNKKIASLLAFVFGLLVLSSPAVVLHDHAVQTASACETMPVKYSKIIDTKSNNIVNIVDDGTITIEYYLLNIHNYFIVNTTTFAFESYCKLTFEYNYISDTYANVLLSFSYIDDSNPYGIVHSTSVSTNDFLNRDFTSELVIDSGEIRFSVENDETYLWTPVLDDLTDFSTGYYEFAGSIDWNAILNETTLIESIITAYGYHDGYSYGYDIGLDDGYDLGYEQGQEVVNQLSFQNGYNEGYQDATDRYSDGSLSLNGVLSAIITAPATIIKEGLDFEILGFNVGSLVMSLIVIGLVVWAIGFFKKG